VRRNLTLTIVLLATLAVMTMFVAPQSAEFGASAEGTYQVTVPLTARSYAFPSGRLSRFGLGSSTPRFAEYPVNDLRLGWYWNWGAAEQPPRPGGIAYVQTIRLRDNGNGSATPSPGGAKLASIVAANPGAIWLIGNEPDCINQDSLMPAVYARAYHEVYGTIKSLDPTAQIAAGQIVQPTPVRLAWLDLVLATYRDMYGTDLPVDLWAIHAYILNERPHENGAELPPGITDTSQALVIPWGENYLTADVETFKGFVRAFRTWMTANGYRDVPLIITEFGVLIPEDVLARNSQAVGPSEGRQMILSFMEESFSFLQHAADSSTGLPHDGNRLVQAWAWYSHSDWSFGGPLFYDDSLGITVYGQRFKELTWGLTARPNLTPVSLEVLPAQGGSPAALTARLANNGTSTPPGRVRVRFYAGSPSSPGEQIGTDQWIDTMYGIATVHTASVEWPGGDAYVVIDPLNEISELNETDNALSLS
jgi:hypothetical protein